MARMKWSGHSLNEGVNLPANKNLVLNQMCEKSFGKISNDDIRKTFLNLHNKSKVAQGKAKMGNGNMARQAVMMRRLTYECSLELSAYRSAKRCEDAVGNTTIAENRIMLPNTNVDFSFAAEQV
ncbi:hypothetical protein ANCDUO_04974 [Ancylostoma duodenale]|uniref:SCP domain-containing protein n=1 Tax=Ancylostoma duodenale TaxID=51022 RepID=A0A0C2DPX7_9BILA|nr:hypothetical protein ANCDUO_04974 [Ancylostoma duodenale]